MCTSTTTDSGYDRHVMSEDLRAVLTDMAGAGPFVLDGSANSAFLGKGATSSVFRVMDPRSGKRYAAKLFLNNLVSAWDARISIEAAQRLEGKNVVPDLVAHYEVCGGKWIVLIMSLLQPIPMHAIGGAVFAKGMRRCIRLFHEAGFAHGDIHKDNFMYDPETATVRIIDFGLAFDYVKAGDVPFLPPIPRGKPDETYSNWAWILKSVDRSSVDSVHRADIHVDHIMLETLIDYLGI